MMEFIALFIFGEEKTVVVRKVTDGKNAIRCRLSQRFGAVIINVNLERVKNLSGILRDQNGGFVVREGQAEHGCGFKEVVG